MFFTLPIMHEMCIVTLKHNMNNKDKIEFTKKGVLWSHTVCLKESCLRLFDVNQCMKDRSNWLGVTLKFALFNHVFHVRYIKKWFMFFFFYTYSMRQLYWQESVKLFVALIWFSLSHKTIPLAVKDKMRTETGWEEKPNSCCVNTFINMGFMGLQHLITIRWLELKGQS